MAEAKHIPVSFHNPSGPVSNAAILQLAAATPNFLIHEIMINDGSFRKSITNEEVVFDDGYIKIGDKPGLGIEVNEEEIQKKTVPPDKSAPLHGHAHRYKTKRRHGILF